MTAEDTPGSPPGGAAAAEPGPGPEDSWRDRLRPLLEAAARRREKLAYRDLALLASVPPPHSIHKLTLALEDLVREDAAAGRPLLAALAVSRLGEGLPGRGFFQLLRELGLYDGPDLGPEAAACQERLLSDLLARERP